MLQQQDLNKLPRYYVNELCNMGKDIKDYFMRDSVGVEFNPHPNDRDGWIDLCNADEETWTYIAYLAQVCKPTDIEILEKEYNASR